ncbi:putative iron-regulated membrane protein [Mucilaginibacter frigoritolerans]|uniref:Putative iron-regulated membrane protein n=1 Tax=Mucilaginibacter frigoritolerans TaxID=652788 RepID=A0A562TP21_9SPHI|nr:PepSY-associated TM helix domain-containing protein [Mucilaginibacter frigoritolerans]TWI95329.1 putative iron-regulated membrane protein [Mucilaginibacter frigoritolerans]
MATKHITLKYLIRQLHLILGLASGLVVVIVALTGSLYVFEQEGRELFQHDFYHVQQVGHVRLPLTQMTDTLKSYYPKDKIKSIRFKEDKDAAIIFYIKKDRAISVDPYTSKIIGVKDLNHDFFEIDEDIHKHLLLGDVGSVIIKCNVLIFLVMCISGLILWWPKQRRFFKKAITINFKTKNWKLLNWELHSVLGFYTLIVLLTISMTGIFFVYDSAKSTVAFLTGQPIPKKEKKLKSKPKKDKIYSIDEAYAVMASANPGASETFITPPADSIGTIRILMRYPSTIVRNQSSLYFNQYTGKVLKTDRYQDYTAYDKVAQSNRNIHIGNFGLGIGGKIIWFLSGLTAASLPITGFMVWLGRNRKKKRTLTNSSIK